MGKGILDSQAQHDYMMTTPIPKLVTHMAVPTVISQLITVIYNTADTYFVSQIDTSAAAAVGIVFSLMSLIQAVGFGLGMGANSLISRALGAKDDEDAYKYASSAFCAAVIFGTLLMIGGLLGLKGMMRVLGSTETILPYACDYGRYILIGAPVMCSAFVLNNILRSEGEAVLAMRGLCTGGILNMILDPILIFKFHMGISGAAAATVISQVVSWGILFSTFVRQKSIVKLGISWISKSLSDYILIVKTGFPTICRQGLASLASALLNVQTGLYGDAAVAAITIANKVYLLLRNIVIGIGQGFQPVAGYNYGAKQQKRVREAFVFTSCLGSAVCFIAAVLLAFQAENVIALFRKDPEVILIGTRTLYFCCMVMPFMAYSTYVNQLYQCLGFSKWATFLASCRQGIFFIPLVLILPSVVGISGVQIVQPAADFFTFLISIPFQISFFKKNLSTKNNYDG